MIDANSENLISLADAGRLLPARRKGKKPHIRACTAGRPAGAKGSYSNPSSAGAPG